MDDPELSNDEAVLAKALKIFVKSISFEGMLTNKRIILTDREKNLLLPKKIPLGNIKETDTGEDKNHNPTLTLSVLAKPGVTRQLVLTFPRQPRGKRNRERDEWVEFIREIISQSPEPNSSQVVHEPEQVPKKVGTPVASGSGIASVPVQPAATAPKKTGTPAASGSGIASVPVQPAATAPKKTGATVHSGSGIASMPVQPSAAAQKKARTPEASGFGKINVPVRLKVMPPKKAGTPGTSAPGIASVPVQAKETAPRHPMALKTKGRIHPSRKILEQGIASPAHSPEPVKQGKSVSPAKRLLCPQCGTKVPSSSLFCHRCGARIAQSP